MSSSHKALPVLKDQQELLEQLIKERVDCQTTLDLVMNRLDRRAFPSESDTLPCPDKRLRQRAVAKP